MTHAFFDPCEQDGYETYEECFDDMDLPGFEELVEIKLPTKYGDFKLKAFKQITTGEEHLALIKGQWDPSESVLVRVHSSCFTIWKLMHPSPSQIA